jgi:hypothetical protein
MSESTEAIAAHIEQTREDLGANLRALEVKAKSMTDWRRYLGSGPVVVCAAIVSATLLYTVCNAIFGTREKVNARRGFLT